MLSTKRSEQFIYQHNFRKHRTQLQQVKSLTHTLRADPPVDSHQLFQTRQQRQRSTISSENRRILERIRSILLKKDSPPDAGCGSGPSYGFRSQLRKQSRQRFQENEAILLRLAEARPGVITRAQRSQRQEELQGHLKISRRNWYETCRSKKAIASLNDVGHELKSLAVRAPARPQTSKL